MVDEPGGEPVALIDAEGNFVEDWVDQLPDEIFEKDEVTETRKEGNLREHKTLAALAKSHLAGQSQIGKIMGADKMLAPAEGWTEDDWAEFNRKIGVPDEATGYAITRPDSVPEKDWSPERVGKWQGLFHKAGLRPSQVDMLVAADTEERTALAAAQEKAVKDAQTELAAQLKASRGNNFQAEYDLAMRAVNTFGSPELAETLKSEILYDEPAFSFLVKIAKAMGEDKLAGGGQPAGTYPSDVVTQRNKYINDNMDAYLDENATNHEDVVNEVRRLFQLEIDLKKGTTT